MSPIAIVLVQTLSIIIQKCALFRTGVLLNFRAEGALTIECQRTDYGLWICECPREAFVELFGGGNGAGSLIGIGYKTLRSCYMYSIDETNRGYARPNRFGRLKLKLCRVTDSRFSDLTNVWYAQDQIFAHVASFL